MPGDGRYLGASAGVPQLWPRWLLRFFKKQTCHETLPPDQASSRAILRAWGRLALVLRGRSLSGVTAEGGRQTSGVTSHTSAFSRYAKYIPSRALSLNVYIKIQGLRSDARGPMPASVTEVIFYQTHRRNKLQMTYESLHFSQPPGFVRPLASHPAFVGAAGADRRWSQDYKPGYASIS